MTQSETDWKREGGRGWRVMALRQAIKQDKERKFESDFFNQGLRIHSYFWHMERIMVQAVNQDRKSENVNPIFSFEGLEYIHGQAIFQKICINFFPLK